MPSMSCEICRFHPATRTVAVIEAGHKREMKVCDVHRRVAMESYEPSPIGVTEHNTVVQPATTD